MSETINETEFDRTALAPRGTDICNAEQLVKQSERLRQIFPHVEPLTHEEAERVAKLNTLAVKSLDVKPLAVPSVK
jgi:hypothetical protein